MLPCLILQGEWNYAQLRMTYPLMSVSTILRMTKRGVRAAASRLVPEMVAHCDGGVCAGAWGVGGGGGSGGGVVIAVVSVLVVVVVVGVVVVGVVVVGVVVAVVRLVVCCYVLLCVL